MAVLTPADTFDDVYQIATADPVKGGAVSGAIDAPTDGHTNAPLQALTNRTEYLYNRLLPAGVILPFGGIVVPTGFLACNGASVSRTTYAILFSAIGTAYGAANGTTFRVPDFRGRFLRGTNTFSGTSGLDPDAASRTAMATGGNTGDAVGSVQEDAFEAHTHNVSAEAADETGNGAITGGTNTSDPNTTVATASTGGSETRPINAYVNFIISTGL